MLVPLALGAATLFATKQAYSSYRDLGANIQSRQNILLAKGDTSGAQLAVNLDSATLDLWGFLAVGLGAATAYSIWKG